MHEKVYDEFVEKAKARAINRAVGDPFKAGMEQGPQVKETNVPILAFRSSAIPTTKCATQTLRYMSCLCTLI